MVIALAGNPNVGKSVVFQALTGRYGEVSNFPGTTVSLSRGRMGSQVVVDTPGIYGLSRFTAEEGVAVEALRSADIIVNVVDARHLPRDLFLTLQLKELGRPLLVVLNMMDEIRRDHVYLNADGLQAALGVPVLKASAVRGEGIPELRRLLSGSGWAPPAPPAFWEELPPAVRHLDAMDRLLWREEDATLVGTLGSGPVPGQQEVVYTHRRRAADDLARRFFQLTGVTKWPERIDRVLMNPWTGLVVVAGLLFGLYESVGVLIANRLVSSAELALQSTWVPAVETTLAHVVTPGSFIFRLLAGEYGLLTNTVTYLLGLLLPLVTGFYLLLAVLEDSGYLPRLATLLDGWFLRLGLNGRAVIPLVLGFGCVTMATLTTRILSGERERKIATVLLAWTIPCSAQMGVITGLLAGLGSTYAVVFALTVLTLFVGVGTVLDRTLAGDPVPLLLDLPPLRLPRPINVFHKTRQQVTGFLREAAPLFLLGNLVIESGKLTGWLGWLERALSPLMTVWLRLPAGAASAFILGFIRRDFGTVALYQADLAPHQILTGAVTLTLFVPCMASTLVLFREQGVKSGLGIWLGSIALALLTGGMVARLAP